MFRRPSIGDREVLKLPTEAGDLTLEQREFYYGFRRTVVERMIAELRWYFRDNPRTRAYRWVGRATPNGEETDIEQTQVHIAGLRPDNPQKYPSVLVEGIRAKSRDLFFAKPTIRLYVPNTSNYLLATGTSTRASMTGVGASYSVVITGSNDALVLAFDGAAEQTVTIPHATYTLAQLVTALESLITGGYPDANGGQLRLSSASLGALSSVQVVSGSAITVLGLSAGTSAGTGPSAYSEDDRATVEATGATYAVPQYVMVGERRSGYLDATLRLKVRAYTPAEADDVVDIVLEGMVGQIGRNLGDVAMNLVPDTLDTGDYESEPLTNRQVLTAVQISVSLRSEWYTDFYYQAVNIAEVVVDQMNRLNPDPVTPV